MKVMQRGQITTFIVVGIIILFAVGFVLYAASIRPELRIFAEKETELQQFIGLCLEDTAEEAITVIGTTGGYLEIPDNIAINERAYFAFAPRTEPRIPLWYYRGEPRIPTKQFIADQISRYIEDNIQFCLGDFDIFKDRLELKLIGNVTAETTIEEREVFVKLNYPLETKEKLTGEITRHDFVGRNIDVKLGRMHDMAIDILRAENRLTFFENITIDLLASRSDFPFTGMEFDCSPKSWRKSELVNAARDTVFYNIRRITVEGNDFIPFNNDNEYARNHFIMPMEKRYTDLDVAFSSSLTSRFELHVRPNDREILRSNVGRSQNPLLRFFCINTYHFTYDIEYPVLATLKDDNAFDDEGFLFNFAFPVTIIKNKGEKRDFSLTQFQSEDLVYEFCQETAATTVDIRVKDAFTFEELYQVPVDYKCVRLLCELGETTADGASVLSVHC